MAYKRRYNEALELFKKDGESSPVLWKNTHYYRTELLHFASQDLDFAQYLCRQCKLDELERVFHHLLNRFPSLELKNVPSVKELWNANILEWTTKRIWTRDDRLVLVNERGEEIPHTWTLPDRLLCLLLEYGVDISQARWYCGTSLQKAIENLDFEVMYWLIEHGIDVNRVLQKKRNVRTRRTDPPLIHLVLNDKDIMARNNHFMIEMLLRKGKAKITPFEDEENALHYACDLMITSQSLAMTRLLLKYASPEDFNHCSTAVNLFDSSILENKTILETLVIINFDSRLTTSIKEIWGDDFRVLFELIKEMILGGAHIRLEQYTKYVCCNIRAFLQFMHIQKLTFWIARRYKLNSDLAIEFRTMFGWGDLRKTVERLHQGDPSMPALLPPPAPPVEQEEELDVDVQDEEMSLWTSDEHMNTSSSDDEELILS